MNKRDQELFINLINLYQETYKKLDFIWDDINSQSSDQKVIQDVSDLNHFCSILTLYMNFNKSITMKFIKSLKNTGLHHSMLSSLDLIRAGSFDIKAEDIAKILEVLELI